MTIKINYIEIPVKDIKRSKTFFEQAFGWQFIDYGDEYVAIENAGIAGGMYLSTSTANSASGSVLVVMYSEQLENTMVKITDCGGKIVKSIFSFPGGRRFHFTDPNDNEYAVWSDK